MICPATLQPCIDDLCRGGGCLKMPGESGLVPCPGCGQLVSIDGSGDFDECECDPDDYDHDEEVFDT